MIRVACAAIVLLLLPSSSATAAEGDGVVEGKEETREFDTGHFYVGAVYSFGLGSSFVDGGSTPLKEIGVGGGLNLGVKLPSELLWCELGVAVGPYASRARMGDGTSDEALSADEEETLSEIYGTTMPFYLEVRFLFPVKGPHVYWAGSLLPGFFIHESHYDNAEYSIEVSNTHLSFSTTIRTGPAFILNDWVEIRLDLVGMELIFEKAFGVLYSPSFAIVLRI
jgi:hypothetical protein